MTTSNHLLVLWVFLAGGTASAEIVNQPPLNTGGPAADLAYQGGLGQQRLADDIQVAHDVVIRQILWHGFYGDDFLKEVELPPASETMRIRFYEARSSDGLPDETAILFDESFINPTRVATGRNVSVGPFPPEFLFHVDLFTPFELAADQRYWLEILQVGDLNSRFRWEFSSGTGSPFAFINPSITDWRLTTLNANLAFQLSAVPEPSTLLLCISFLVLWGRKKR